MPKSFRDAQRRYDNALPPSYFAPDAEDEEEPLICFYCGESVTDNFVGSPLTKIICDDCILEHHERERGEYDETN